MILVNKVVLKFFIPCFSHVRTNQIGTYKYRDPKKIDDKKLYNRLVGRMIGNLLTRGPDKEPSRNPHR